MSLSTATSAVVPPEALPQTRLNSEQKNITLQSPHTHNTFGQPVGFDLANWAGAKLPNVSVLQGHYVHMVPLDLDVHTDDLWAEFKDTKDSYYTYLFHGPFRNKDEFRAGLQTLLDGEFYYLAILDNVTKRAIGYINLMRIDPVNGSIEIGCVCFGPKLHGNRRGTEVVWLLMQYVFTELGYRRFEWKCDVHNLPSRRAALRFGFTFEGIFRLHYIYRGRERDTSWYSITHHEFFEALTPAYQQYLAPSNFHPTTYNHIKTLQECIKAHRLRFDDSFAAAHRAGKQLTVARL